MRTVLRFSRSLPVFSAAVLVPILADNGLFAEWDETTRLLVVASGLTGGLLLLKLIIFLVSRLSRVLNDWILIARYNRESRRLGAEEVNFAGATAISSRHDSGHIDGTSTLRSEMDDARENQSLLLKESETLQAELEQSRQTAARMEGEKNDLAEKIVRLQTNLAELQACRDRERDAREEAAEQVSRVKETLEILQAEWTSVRAELEERVSELATRSDALRLESETLQTELEQSRQTAGQTEVEKNDLNDRVARLQRDLTETESCRDRERATREDAEKQAIGLKETLETREAEWVSARKELDGRVSELAARGDASRHESETLQAELEASRQTAGQTEVEKNDLNDKIARLQRDLTETESCRDRERATREDAEKQVIGLKETLEAREAEWVSARKELDGRVSELAARGDALRRELEEERREARRTEDELLRTLKTVKEKMAKDRESAQGLEAERNSVRAELESLRSEQDELVSNLSAENEALRLQAADVEEKRRHLEMLRARVDEVETQLNEARKTLTSTESALENQREAATLRLSRAMKGVAIWKRKSATLQQFHDSILRSIPMALIVTDKEDRIIRWNLKALRLLDLPEDEVLGRNLFEADSALKETVFRQKFGESGPQTKPKRSVIRYKGPESEVIYVVTTSPLRVAGGDVSGRLFLIERSVRKPALAN